jgi:hypothetical protein
MILRLLACLKTHAMLHARIPTIRNLRIPLCANVAPSHVCVADFARPVEGAVVLVEMRLVAEGGGACCADDAVGVCV